MAGIEDCGFYQGILEAYGPEVARDMASTLGKTAIMEAHADVGVDPSVLESFIVETGEPQDKQLAESTGKKAGATESNHESETEELEEALTQLPIEHAKAINLSEDEPVVNAEVLSTEPEPLAIDLVRELDHNLAVGMAERSARQSVAEAFARDAGREEDDPSANLDVAATQIVSGHVISTRDAKSGATSEQISAAPAQPETPRIQLLRPEVVDAPASAGQQLTNETPDLSLLRDDAPESASIVAGDDIGRLDAPEVSGIETEPAAVAGEADIMHGEFEPANAAAAAEAVPVTDIETLLALPEPFAVGVEPAAAPEGSQPEQAKEPAVFTEQVALLVEQAVEPERQLAVEAMFEQVCAIIDIELEAAMAQTEETEDSAEAEISEPGMTEELEVTDELEAIVTTLLQELGVAEPTPEQIERFVGLVRAEKLAASNSAAQQTTVETDAEEQSSDSGITVWQRYRAFLRLHQPLGELALI